MSFADLSTVQHRIQLGQPLPFDVLQADHTLLLAKGQTLYTAEQLNTLLNRGTVVRLRELLGSGQSILQAPRALLPQLWQHALGQLGVALRQTASTSFKTALADASEPVLSLVARDPDLAIFQVVRQGAGADVDYGAQRSLQTAITSLLVAQRLGWAPEESERAFKVALTMNLSMLELQGQLSRQGHALTPLQRQTLQTHPMRSVRLLEQAGVADADWLQAVLRHHENEDGSGYPSGTTEVGELASLVRRADVYTSKLSGRSTRDAIGADLAGRQMFMQDPGHPMTAALVKEFGIYPPGCHVRLASGELAVVVARTGVITAPVVACLTNERGTPLPQPVRRDTSVKAHAVQAVVGEKQAGVQAPLERLMAALTA
jgi:HD-GYP domain-containing protein (c-di-GMP phosphodiesterase class II)